MKITERGLLIPENKLAVVKKETPSERFKRMFDGRPEELYSYMGVEKQESVLPNGLKVVLLRRPGMNVSLLAGTTGGGRYDEGRLGGRAHFNEHMITSGTEKYPHSGQMEQVVEREGGYFNAFTNSEMMAVDVRMKDTADLSLAMEVASQCLTKAIFDPETVETERGAVLDEMSKGEEDLEKNIFIVTQKATYPGTQLEIPVIGTKDTVSNLSREDLMGHVREMIVGNKMVLVVSGNIEMDNLMDQAEQMFGSLVRGDKTEKAGVLPENKVDDGVIVKRYPESDRVAFNLGFRTNPLCHKDNAALDVLADILGGGGSGLLMQKLRFEKGTGLVYGAYSYHREYSDAGAIHFYGSTSKEKFQKGLDIMMDLLKDVHENGVPAELVETMINRTTKQYMGGLEACSSWANVHFPVEIYSRRSNGEVDPEYLKYPIYSSLKRCNEVTPEDIKRVAKKYLKPERLRMAVCGNITKDDFKVNY